MSWALVAQISTLVNTSNSEFVDFGLDFGDLFHMLLCWKCKLLNNLNWHLVTLGATIIFPQTKRQAASGWNTDRLLPEAVSNFIRFITDTFIGLLWIWYRVHNQCSVYCKIATNYRMYTACLDVPEINQVNNILMCTSECWQLDKLATCFGVFFVDFCMAKVKERTV